MGAASSSKTRRRRRPDDPGHPQRSPREDRGASMSATRARRSMSSSHHAHDVSRGGIYIKTGSPFPPGTLLKFEIGSRAIRLITASGGSCGSATRAGTGELPSGMGVRFIRIDEPSKTVIDRWSIRGRRGPRERSGVGDARPSTRRRSRAAAAVAARRRPRRPSNRVGKPTMLGIGRSPGGGPRDRRRPVPVPSVLPRPLRVLLQAAAARSQDELRSRDTAEARADGR